MSLCRLVFCSLGIYSVFMGIDALVHYGACIYSYFSWCFLEIISFLKSLGHQGLQVLQIHPRRLNYPRIRYHRSQIL